MEVSPTPVDVSWIIQTAVDNRSENLAIESARTKATSSKSSDLQIQFGFVLIMCFLHRMEAGEPCLAYQ